MRTVRLEFGRAETEAGVTARSSGAHIGFWVLSVVALMAVAGVGMSRGKAASIASAQTASAPLRKIAEFELPGPPGKRFDYLTIDEDDNYLLSALLGAGLLHVIDLMIVPTIVVTTVLRITYLRTAAELTSPGVGTGCLTIRSKNAPAPIAVHLW